MQSPVGNGEDVSKLPGHKSIEVHSWVTKGQDRLDETLERARAAMA